MPMNTTTRSIAILCAVSLACATGALAQAPYVPATADTFYDDFSAGIVDPAKWYAANKNWGGKVNGEDYNGGVVPSNLLVRAGLLRCEAHGNRYEGDVIGIAKNGQPRRDGRRVGACAVTRDYYASGSYEIRARVAPVTGVCCTMWTFEYEELYPGDPGFQGSGDYYVVNHEIDIEMPGRPGSAHTGIGYDYALCNTWVGENEGEYTSSHMKLPARQDDGAFHVYRFDWHTGDRAGTVRPRVEFYFDGVPVVTNYTHIPTKAGRLWVGAWFPNGWAGTPDFDTSVFEVDYVRIVPFHEENDEPQNETYGSDGLAEPVNLGTNRVWQVGDSVVATLDPAGVLTLAGPGTMYGFAAPTNAPWNPAEVAGVVVGDGVVPGANAFAAIPDAVPVRLSMGELRNGFGPSVPDGMTLVSTTELEAPGIAALEISDGTALLGIGVCTNADLNAKAADWAPISLEKGDLGVSADGTRILVPVPVNADRGFMLLRSGDR